MVTEFSTFPATELQIGHIIPTGVVLSVMVHPEENGEDMILAMTASGIGHAFKKSEMIDCILGRVSDDIAAKLRDDFAAMYEEMMREEGSETED